MEAQRHAEQRLHLDRNTLANPSNFTCRQAKTMTLKHVDLGQDNHWLHLKIMHPDTSVTQFLVQEAVMKENGDCEIKLLENGITTRPVWITIQEQEIADFKQEHIRYGDTAKLASASAQSISDPLDWRLHRQDKRADLTTMETDQDALSEPQLTP